MNNYEFRALLDALMVSDPRPHQCFAVLELLADRVSVERGYEDWIDAYHKFKDN